MTTPRPAGCPDRLAGAFGSGLLFGDLSYGAYSHPFMHGRSGMKSGAPSRCPYCSGSMVYRMEARSLVCDSCAMKLTPEEYDRLMASQSREEPPENDHVSGTARGSGNFRKPEKTYLIIPFEKCRAEFQEALLTEVRKRPFVPKGFIREMRKATPRAVYLPFMLYDIGISGEILYSGEKLRYLYQLPKMPPVYEHSVYECRTAGEQKYVAVPGYSGGMISEEQARELEPYEIFRARSFSPSWLSGMPAETPRNIRTCRDKVRARAEDSFEKFLVSHGQYDHVRCDRRNFTSRVSGARSALFPFWILETCRNGVRYRFVMNGTTGKCSGIFPMSFWRSNLIIVAIWFLSGALVLWNSAFILSGGLNKITPGYNYSGNFFGTELIFCSFFGGALGTWLLTGRFLKGRLTGVTAVILLSSFMTGAGIFIMMQAVSMFGKIPGMLSGDASDVVPVTAGVFLFLGYALIGIIGARAAIRHRSRYGEETKPAPGCDYCESSGDSVISSESSVLLSTGKGGKGSFIEQRKGAPGKLSGEDKTHGNSRSRTGTVSETPHESR